MSANSPPPGRSDAARFGSSEQALWELLSAQHDRECSAAEARSVEHLRTEYPAQTREFETRSNQLGAALLSLNVQPVGPEFAASVVAVIQSLKPDKVLRNESTLSPDKLEHQPKVLLAHAGGSARSVSVRAETRSGFRQMATFFVSTAALALVLIVLGSGTSSRRADDSGSGKLSSRPRFRTPLSPPETNQVPFEAAAAAGNRVVARGDEWQVLVVKLASRDREAAIRQVEQVAIASGLEIPPIDSHREPIDRFGVILTSVNVASSSFVDNISRIDDVISTEWNPNEIANMDRNELIATVRRSMLTPTKSELYFGEVYLAAPLHADGAQSRNLQAAQVGDRALKSPLANRELAQSGNQAAPGAPSADTRRQNAAEGSVVVAETSGTDSRSLPPAVLSDSDRSISAQDALADSNVIPGKPMLVVFEFDSSRDAHCL